MDVEQLDMAERRRRGARIAQAREDAGLTQKQLAAKAKISVRALQGIEARQRAPQRQILEHLEAALGLDYSGESAPNLNAVDIDVYPLLVAIVDVLSRTPVPMRALRIARIIAAMSEIPGTSEPEERVTLQPADEMVLGPSESSHPDMPPLDPPGPSAEPGSVSGATGKRPRRRQR